MFPCGSTADIFCRLYEPILLSLKCLLCLNIRHTYLFVSFYTHTLKGGAHSVCATLMVSCCRRLYYNIGIYQFKLRHCQILVQLRSRKNNEFSNYFPWDMNKTSASSILTGRSALTHNKTYKLQIKIKTIHVK